MVSTVLHNGKTLAIIISRECPKAGVSFFTPDDFSQQLACIAHSAGKVIEPHIHRLHTRHIELTQEVLVIQKGKIRVDFYDAETVYLESRILVAGDIILLAAGGHGFEVIEDLEMIEVKQGPYAGDQDKCRFQAMDHSKLNIVR